MIGRVVTPYSKYTSRDVSHAAVRYCSPICMFSRMPVVTRNFISSYAKWNLKYIWHRVFRQSFTSWQRCIYFLFWRLFSRYFTTHRMVGNHYNNVAVSQRPTKELSLKTETFKRHFLFNEGQNLHFVPYPVTLLYIFYGNNTEFPLATSYSWEQTWMNNCILPSCVIIHICPNFKLMCHLSYSRYGMDE